MTDDILFFCAKMMVGHDGLLSDMSVGRASLYQKIPSCPNFYLMWCTLKWNSPVMSVLHNCDGPSECAFRKISCGAQLPVNAAEKTIFAIADFGQNRT
jgi:hypothetical protein